LSNAPAFERFPDDDPLTGACAYHQSGHLIVAHYNGWRIVHADIFGCAGNSDQHLPLAQAPKVSCHNLLESCRMHERLATFKLAGPAALRIVGWEVDMDASCSEDLSGAGDLLRQVVDEDLDVERAIEHLHARTNLLLLHHLEELHGLAAAFLRLLILGPQDVSDAIGLAHKDGTKRPI
jgi:hypothetical protein